MIDEKYFTTEQVANILQVHPFTILKYIKQGKLKGIKLGRVYRIKESDIKKFLEERMTKSGEKEAKKEIQEESTIKTTHFDIDQKRDDKGHFYKI